MLTGATALEAIGPADSVGENFAASEFAELSAGPAPKRGGYAAVKVGAEWLVALVLFVLTAPLMLALALLVKFSSPGPAFYSQTRLGQYGRKYRILKLRTMVHNAEAPTGPVWASKNDVRITLVGRLLRRTHLDELPQLWNVLRGEMGLIGPRPERPEIACRIQRRLTNFHLRLLVRPGVTGLAQMLLPADDPHDVAMEGVRRKLSHDLYYIRELGILLDLRIAICTPCYFLAAAVDSVRQGLLRSHGNAAECACEVAGPDEEGRERAA
jgi:lipopolysaccharide/colanic/teichoic acid biosynthesis glycosyltransferase